MTRTCIPWGLVALSLLHSCGSMGIKGQAGYGQMSFGGEIALSPGSGAPVSQDVESALGLGDDNDSPYARLELDFGLPVISVSALRFEESGQGTLQAQFGNIVAGTTVASDLEFGNAKAALAFDVDLGVVKFAPGIAVDMFDFELKVRDTLTAVTEDIDVLAPVPMVFARGQVELPVVSAVAEVGYIDLDLDDIDGQFLDAEAWIELRPVPTVFLFAGYRYIRIEGDGVTDGQSFAADFDVRGWQVGGGIRF